MYARACWICCFIGHLARLRSWSSALWVMDYEQGKIA
jgi:hypothetical protein